MSGDFDPDRTVAFHYVPQERRAAISALWTLDVALGKVVRTTREPMIGQMRMAWWHERLSAIDVGERIAEPVLAGLAAHVRDHDVSGAALTGLIDGWEVLLDPPPLGAEALTRYARERGARLFALTALLLGGPVAARAGERWALVDLACNASPALATQARDAARAIDPKETGPKALRVLTRIGSARLRRPAARIAAPLNRWEGMRAVFG